MFMPISLAYFDKKKSAPEIEKQQYEQKNNSIIFFKHLSRVNICDQNYKSNSDIKVNICTLVCSKFLSIKPT